MKNVPLRYILFFIAAALTLSCAAQTNAPVPTGNGLQISVTPDTRMTGRSNHREVLMRIQVVRGNDTEETELNSLTVNLQGTEAGDLRILQVITTGSSPNPKFIGPQSLYQENTTYDPVPEPSSTSLQTVLVRDLPPTLSEDIHIPLHYRLTADSSYLWITADITDTAREGNRIVLTLKDLRTDRDIYPINIKSEREILLRRRVLYSPGDFDSKFFRIPAIITAKNGTLVTATDRRKFNNNDLPEDIDIILNYSSSGQFWGGPAFLALGRGVGKGFGDCALVHTRDEGGLLAVYAGGVGFWQSTPDNPLRIYCRQSTDNGNSWSPTRDITHFLYGPDCSDTTRRKWRGAFCASGNGLLTSTGRIMFVAAVRESEDWSANDYVLYSDDNGETWQCSQRACVGGDEAKVVELRDGRILMSIRHQGERWFNISEDGGVTWRDTVFAGEYLNAPACNGDIIRYDLEDGTDILLHSLPLGNGRKNVAVMISFDDGKSWPLGKVIVFHNAAYSSLCILPDGSIGMYVEEDPNGGDSYEMVFYNFTLDWLEGRHK